MIRNAHTCVQVPTFRYTTKKLVHMTLLLPVLIILSAGLALGADDAPKRPEWCRPGFVCVQTSEVVADTEYHLDLREQIAKYRGSSRRFGLTIGFGLGVGGVVDDEFDVRWVPTGGCFLVWGIRF